MKIDANMSSAFQELNQASNDEQKASALLKQGYSMDSIQTSGGLGKAYHYLTKMTKPGRSDKLLWLPRRAFASVEQQVLLNNYRKVRLSELKRSYNREYNKRRRVSAPDVKKKTLKKALKSKIEPAQDAEVANFVGRGYIMDKITGIRGVKSWSQYLTIFNLPDQPESTVGFWLTSAAFNTDHEKMILLKFRLYRRREKKKQYQLEQVLSDKDHVGDVEKLTRIPDARFSCGYRTVTTPASTAKLEELETHVKTERSGEKCLKNHGNIPGVKDFSVQVDPSDFQVDLTRRKKQTRKQVRDFATQTSLTYFIWDTV